MFKNRFLFLLSVCMLCTVLIQAQDNNQNVQDTFAAEKIRTSVFLETEMLRGYFYVSLYGARYRQAYTTTITAPVVPLDTYKNGLKVMQQVGGDHSRVLLLADEHNTKYTLRALRKNPTAYLNNKTLKEEYELGALDDTYTADFIDDMGTGAHPYISLAVGSLARDLDVVHTFPSLIYVPRDGALGSYANNFGDALYYIEKQIPSEILKNGNPSEKDTIVTTKQVLAALRADASNKIDETAYIRARIFDMLIGDWNRGASQWDWLGVRANGSTMYTPISKNSDQAFSKMGDGPLMRLTTFFSKRHRHLENYDGELLDPKWLNRSAFALDKTLISNLDLAFWDAEAEKMMQGLTEDVIEKAFARIPQELEARISEEITINLKERRDNLPQLVASYVALLSKLVVVKGTDKDDRFTISRMPDGHTIITGHQINGSETPFYKQTIYKESTNRVWLYGLEGNDSFQVVGTEIKHIPISIFGGQNDDSYDIKNKENIHLYDFPSQGAPAENLKVKLIDEPEAGIYNYKRVHRYANKLRPLLGVNIDDGLRVGVENTFTDYGFQHLPFAQQHTLGASFYFATSGFDLQYSGQWTHVIGKLDPGLDIHFTSPNYTLNFFGFGNESINPNKEDPENFRLNYNRVRIQKFRIAPSIAYRDPSGYSLKTSIGYASINIDETNNRFIETYYNGLDSVPENKFVELVAAANFSDTVQDYIPFFDVDATLIAGNSFNLTETSNAVFINPQLKLGLPFDKNERVKLVNSLATYINFNNNIEFYQGASLGAESGLRGYRNQRFTGINSFVQSSDLQFKLNRLQTKLIPIDLGIYAGFDHGRVWGVNDVSKDWKTAVGGGLFFDTTGVLVGDISAFHSDEGLRIAVKLGVGF